MSVNQENLVRILSDKAELETHPIFCFFGLHRWTKWSKPTPTQDRLYIDQQRLCVHCNKGQYRQYG